VKEFPWLKKYPSDIPWQQEIVPRPLFKILDGASERFPHNYALNFLGKRYTYNEVRELSDKVAEGLQAIGVVKNTRVGLLMPNTPYYVIFYFGILKAGGIVVNFNPLYVSAEIRSQINDCAVEVMVTLDLEILFPKVYENLSITSMKKIIVCPLSSVLPFPKNILFPFFKAKERARVPSSSEIILFDRLIKNEGRPHNFPVNPEEDIAVIQYTGGTTGFPKGAMLSHYNTYSNVMQCAAWFSPLVEMGREKTLAALPFFHVFAMTVVMNLTLQVGGDGMNELFG
jgi:long-chain acyl-CoA synthetase